MGIWTTFIGFAMAIGGSQIAVAQSLMFDGAYKGTVRCQELESDIGIVTAPLAIIIRNRRVTASIPTIGSADIATGVVNADGTFRLALTVYMRKATATAEYTGVIDGANGTLTGTQVWTMKRPEPSSRRTCKGSFSKVTTPR